MGLPSEPVTLSAEQVEEFNKRLSDLRHNINNHLALIVASVELIKFNPDPENAQRMSGTLLEQPPKISEEIKQFSESFDEFLGISR